MTKAGWTTATAVVATHDPAMAELIGRVGPTRPRGPEPEHFDSLVHAIVFQQLAGRAAMAIHARFLGLFDGSKLTPAAVMAMDQERLRASGLSAAKSASIRDLATKVLDGTVPLDDVGKLDDDEIVERLSAVRGIGRWTAEMFLIFQLQRPDVWPVDDLGVRNGWALAHQLAASPTARELAPEGDRFRPYRTAAAWYCWQAVHLARGEL
jgi:DNA-3-methyladenine glycosylase II